MPSSRYYKFKAIDQKEKIKKIKFFIFLIFVLIIFLTITWLIFLSPIFNIKNINITDDSLINRGDIEKIITSIAPFGFAKNLLILPKSLLKSKLAAAFPAITDIAIKKNLFHTLTINFEKRIPVGIWCKTLSSGDCYFFDKDGIIFASAPETEGALILKIENVSKNDISLGDKVLNDNQINFIITFVNKINESGRFKILEFKIKPNPQIDLEAITDKGWSIYLDSAQDPSILVNNLIVALDKFVKNKIKDLKYIDLRIPKNVIYK